MGKNKERTYDELLAMVPAQARPDVASAKNQRIRLLAAHEGLRTESAVFKAKVRVLRDRWGMNPYMIARLMGLSRTRIVELLEDRK